MRKLEFEFRFDGSPADDDTQALADFLADEFPGWATHVGQRQPPPKPPGTRDAALTIAIIALIVTQPSGIKDGLNLAEQIQLKAKFARLIAWAKERRARRQRNPFAVLPPHGASVPLDQVQPEQLLAAVTALASKSEKES